MIKFKETLHQLLGIIKGFESGYTTMEGKESQMLVSFQGKVYKLEITEVDEGQVDVAKVNTHLEGIVVAHENESVN